ncbi:Ig-like domain repeat protein [Methanosphaera sp. WGK6]|uniref:beta strand repeat-containing protein n=1 Tax=Methanosphaera sp. WGK6 TaxID=1561964 RepID=UPI00084C139B|nr:Ig-like domain repeat protein [Methanosphaera sp. WGK6]OED29630.1 hypothetical protein NL43_07165 [Methanosphaera sp. WGK6]
MNRNIKQIFLLITLLFLLVGLSSLSAADTSDNSTTDNSIETTSIHDNVVKTTNNVTTLNNHITKKNIKSEESKITVTPSDLSDDEYILESQKDKTVEFKGNFNNAYITINSNTNMKYNFAEATLKNVVLEIGGTNCTYNALNINCDDYSNLEANYAVSINGKNILIENSTIKANLETVEDSTRYGICIGEELETSNVTIKNSVITMDMIPNYIDWTQTTSPNSLPVYVSSSASLISFISNNITIESLYSEKGYATCYGMTLYGTNITVRENNIAISTKDNAPSWLYALYLTNSNNLIIANNITLIGSNYTAGVLFDSYSFENSTVRDNIISLTVGNKAIDEDAIGCPENVGYGIIFTNRAYQGSAYKESTGNIKHNSAINNTITANGYSIYAIEQFGGDYSIIANNTIDIDATTPTAIGVIGFGTNITGNKITVNGKDNQTYRTADYIKGQTTGICLMYGGSNNVTNNVITSLNNAGIILVNETNDNIKDNDVTSSNNAYAVVLDHGNNIKLEDNTLKAINTNKIYNKNAEEPTDETRTETIITLDIPEPEAEIGETITITVTLTDINGQKIKQEDITLKIGTFTTKITTDNTGSTTYTYKATQAQKDIKVTATYAGNTQYQPSTSDEKTINVEGLETKINIETDSIKTVNNKTNITGTLTSKNNPLSQAPITITLTIKDKTTQINTITDKEGKFTVEYTPTTTGTMNIKANYAGNNTYNPSQDTTWADIELAQTTLSIDTINNVKIDEKITIQGTLIDEFNNKLSGKTIIITINEKTTLTTTTDTNGKYTYTIEANTLGENTITVDFKGDDTYTKSYNNIKFTTNKLTTNINLKINNQNQATVTIGDKIIISGTLTDEFNKPITNAIIKLTIDKTNYNLETDNTGKYTYTYTTTTIKENIPVQVTYDETTKYTTTSTTSTFNVEDIKTVNTQLTINTIPETTITKTVTITGYLTSTRGALANQNIIIKINNQQVSTTTDANGKYTYTYKTVNTGSNTVEVLYEENKPYLSTKATTSFEVTKISTSLSTKVNNEEELVVVIAGYKYNITGTLKDEFNNPISKATIKITVGQNNYTTTTNSQGIFTLTTKAPNTTGTYIITAKYNGNITYDVSTDETEFDVIKVGTTINLTNTTKHVGENVTIIASILDTNKKAVNGTVTLALNGKTLSTANTFDSKLTPRTFTVRNGVVNISVNALKFNKTGNKITITYTPLSNDNTHASSQLSTTYNRTLYKTIYANSKGTGDGLTIKTPTNLTNALIYIDNGGTINLIGTTNNKDTYNLNNQVVISKNTLTNTVTKFTIKGYQNHIITISGQNKTGILAIAKEYTVSIINTTFTRANTRNGGAIFNNGTLTLNNDTFTNNNAYQGSCIYNKGTVTITKTTIKNNNASYGGVILNEGNITMTSNTVINNSAVNSGGVINSKGTVILKSNNFTNNTAAFGGVIYSSGKANITNTNYFIANHVTKNGGAIYNFGVMNLQNNNFTANTANQWSGAVHNARNITVTSNKFALNTAGQLGGAMFNNANGTITSNTFESNRGKYGGAIYNGGVVLIQKNTIRYNNASQTGGAVANKGIVTLKLNKITGNKAVYGGAIFSNNTVAVDSDVITSCSASKSGGAIYNIGNFTVKNTNFTSNKANMGGTIFNAMNMNITNNNIISGNASLGGGLYNDGTTCNVIGNTFTKNHANYGGAAFTKKAITQSKNTYTNNTAIKGPNAYPN